MPTPEEQAAYIDHLQVEIAKLRAEIEQRGAEIERLKNEKGLTREDLTFSDHTGLYSDKAGRLYCPTCVGGNQRNPLKKEKYGWRCTVGGHYFSNPDANPNANAGSRGGGGPDSWMR